MKKSYIENYLKIYFWKGLSIVLNIISMFIVVPELTSQPTIYGIYMLCISLNIFLSYADIGFVSAGYKYAAEYYGRGDLENELKIQGFVNFILSIFVLIPSIIFLILSFNPWLLISDLNSQEEANIASMLLLIQALFSFNVVLNRFNSIAYGIRLEDHKVNQIIILTSLLKIVSVFFYFRGDHYDIVGYFLFGKVIELFGLLVIAFLTKVRFKYKFYYLFTKFKFSKDVYIRTNKLAFASFYGTIMWILYQELDSIVITKLFGAEIFAFFAIGFTFSQFLRSIFSVLFSPFNARFNHLIGQNNYHELKSYYLRVLSVFFPVILFFVLSLIMLRKPIVFTWVGDHYTPSLQILLFLLGAMILNPIKNLSSSIISAIEKIKYIYIINTILVFVYWGIIAAFVPRSGVLSFAFAKFVSFSIANIIYLIITMRLLKIEKSTIIKKLIKPVVLPVLTILIISNSIIGYLPDEKGKINFLIVLVAAGTIFFTSLVAHYVLSNEFRNYITMIFKRIIPRYTTKS